MTIVENERAFTETLFKPINGKTADGYVAKRGKRFCDVWIAGKVYRINRWLVWCKQCEASKVWQHAVLDLPFTLSELDTAARALSTGSEWLGSGAGFAYSFDEKTVEVVLRGCVQKVPEGMVRELETAEREQLRQDWNLNRLAE
jgi:hypothetical protein